MSPKLAAMAQQTGLFQLAGKSSRRHLLNIHLGIQRCQTCQQLTRYLSQTGEKSNLCLERSDANTLIFEQGGKESVLLNIEVKEINRANRITGRMAQDEVCSSRLAMFHQHKQSQLALR